MVWKGQVDCVWKVIMQAMFVHDSPGCEEEYQASPER